MYVCMYVCMYVYIYIYIYRYIYTICIITLLTCLVGVDRADWRTALRSSYFGTRDPADDPSCGPHRRRIGQPWGRVKHRVGGALGRPPQTKKPGCPGRNHRKGAWTTAVESCPSTAICKGWCLKPPAGPEEHCKLCKCQGCPACTGLSGRER